CGIAPVAFVDDTPSRHGASVLGIPVIGASVDAIEHDAVIVAIGDNHARRMITERMLGAGETLATAIHPFASIARSATIGAGAVVVRDIPDDVTAFGVPARITSDRRSETRNR